jgi:hypothetical protein
MQRAPLPVDVTTSVWDVLGAVGDFVGGVGTALALVIAAMAYRRQVDDARRAQAAKILIRFEQGPGDMMHIVVGNAGDTPVYQVKVSLVSGMDDFHPDDIEQAMLPAFAKIYVHPIEEDNREFYTVNVLFEDESGHKWERDLEHGLRSR